MPITEVTGPDGRLHHIEHPAGALPSQIIKIAQSQIGPAPSKPGAVSNLFRAGLAGASEVGYDTLQFLADETIKFRAGEETTRAKIESQYGDQEETLDERLSDIEERKRERLRKSQSIIGDTGRMSGEAFGVEEGRFSADLGRGFGQLVPLVATRGFSAVPMAFMESRRDAEQTFGINYADMDKETQKKVDIAAGTYAMFSYGLNRVGLKAMGLNKLDDFFKGSAKIKGSVVKEIFKGGLKGGSGEFLTETIEAAAMDQGFSRIYDPEREFSFSDIKDYLYEGFIGSIVGTTAGTGTSTVKALAGPPQVAVEEEGKPTEEGKPLEVPRSVEVTYKQIDGKVRVVPIAVSKDQDPLTVAEEVLQGRYDKSQGLIINETFEEQPLDIGDQEADILEEDVPVDPVPVEQAPTPEPAPEQAPEETETPIPFQRDYRNVKVGDTFEIVGVNGKTKQVEAVGISDQSGMIRFKRADGTFGVTGNETDSVFQDINSPEYMLQAAGKGTRGKLIKNLFNDELDALERDINKTFEENPGLNRGIEGAGREHISDLNAIKLERRRREQAPTAPVPVEQAPTPAPTPAPEPSVETAPESEPTPSTDPTTGKTVTELAQDVGITEQQFRETYPDLSRRADERARSTEAEVDPRTGLPGFSLPQNLKKGQPGYQKTQNVKFASDLERAAYSATTTPRDETAKRKRSKYRKILQDAGYSSTEINTMGREVRSQMRKQYKGPGSELSVALPQDIVAQAAPLEKKAKKVTRDYNLLNSPFINNYSGPGPSDTSVPDYNSFHYVVSSAQQKGLNAAIQSGAVDTLANQVVEEATEMMSDPSLAAGIGWYGRMRERLGEIFGEDIDIFTQLLGTTSAQTPVEANFRFSVDLYNRFKAGEFDSNIKKYLKLYGQMRNGQLGQLILKEKIKNSKGVLYTREMIRSSSDSALLSSAAAHYKLEPRKTSGKKYGTNSYPALKALSQVWFDDRLGKNRMTPKTPQFTMNLNGESLEATIDVWAARLLRRVIYSGQADSRIIPSQETAVSNPDFALGQLVFRRAAEKLNMNPDDLQALVWFGEKQIWDRNGWTGAAGALKSSFDEPASVFYPADGSTRTEADANLILDFLAKERLVKRNIDFPDAVSKTSQNKTRKEYDRFLKKSIIVDYLRDRGSGAVYESSSVEPGGEQQRARSIPTENQEDVTAQAAEIAAEDRGPQEAFENGGQVMDFIEKSFNPIAEKLGLAIRPAMRTDYVAQYNVTQKVIEYNPMALLNRSKAGIWAAMREEIIHAAMHNVLIQKEKKARTGRSEDALWIDFFTALGNNLTPQERTEIQNVYQSLEEGNPVAFGSEYSRAVVQKFRYGEFSEQYITPDKGGPAFQAIVDLLRSVQAYMAKVLGPMAKTDPEAAQVIVDTVELLNAIDPAIRPKSQQVVANAYNATDKNTAEENAEGDAAPKDASQRVREERKWWDGNIRSKFSKGLTPIITRLRRINPQFALLFQRLENTIRERNLTYKKQAQPFFNKLNSLNSEDFNELKQLLFFSPTPDEANLPKNRATMQRRDALLHKHGLLNMYRLDVQPILEEIYTQYSELGMPIGYLEDYFPRVVKDLEGLIKSYGYETKRTFGNLVRDENARRKKEGLPEMESSERARFFQDFLQNKFSFGPKGVRPPGNVKIREIQTIPPSKLKFYEDPSIAFGSYTTSMVSAIEAYKVLGATNQTGNKGETGELGKLTERLFQEGKIDEQDASELKSIAELATLQASQELAPLRELGAATYVATLIDVGTVLIQFLDLAKVLVLRGPSATVKGIYRTVTGNRTFDIERDFSILKKQIMAEFDQQSGTQKILNLGLRYIVPFQQMDVAMKHVSVEAALEDYLKKANSPVGSKKYQQLMTELTIRMGPEAAFKAVQGFRKDTFDPNLPEVKEALMMELFDRQPLTYLQIPETHRRNPNSRLLYKLKTFMLLDINFNRQLALNDLMGPGKTVEQRYKGLKMLVSMMAALTALGVPKDLLLDFIRGKDTYLSDHVINNMLQVFGLSRYGVGTIFKDGPVDAIIDRFKPAAYSIVDGTENDLIAWVKGDREISEFKVWKNAPVFDIWGRFTEDFQDKQKEKFREKRKEGQRPTIRR